jgi:DNA replication protein DnaC
LLTHPTIDQLHQLGLTGMARAFTELEANPQSAELSHAEWLGLLLDREATDRYERRPRARLRFARLRHQAAVEDVDYRATRGLDRALFQTLIACRWIEQAQNLIIEGPAGVGKSWLACALGHNLSRQPLGALFSASRACLAILPWRAATPLPASDARPRRRQALDPRLMCSAQLCGAEGRQQGRKQS